MPRERRANIGRRTRHASQQQVYSRNLREERKNIIRENDRLRHRVSTRRSLASYNRLAFQYDPTANYSDDENLDIGRMTTICRYCNAVKFKRETVGLCCASGKVKLDPLLTPPQPLKTLFDGSDPDSSHFLQALELISFEKAASCRLARYKVKYIICMVQWCQHQMNRINFCKYISFRRW
ncbi:uncharacterized protein LOC112685404 [Sipha flava]|uniref:Uncharacterized protein LOC112685404 n=1 Tax=Sipha flava TaxID=143950 RepID=A0A8B8FRF3_9HEMI|nr:uncharacterized protein LOC112685404 [Sipha flava]